MKLLPIMLPLPAAALLSCTDRPVIYTGSQVGIHASGIKNNVPEKLSVGYDRNEYAWFPRGADSSVKGAYDAEYRYPAGIAVSELLITGKAAAGDKTSPEYPPTDKEGNTIAPYQRNPFNTTDLVVSTNTKSNLGLEGLPPSDGSSFSLNFGFKRSVLAIFPSQKNAPNGEDLPSTYTDLTLHANGALTPLNNPQAIAQDRQMTSTASGARIVQTIATGQAARNLATNDEKKLNDRIGAGLGKKSE